jgi:DNA invertase Pin-like site-specific DNA recombinase
MTNRLNHDLVKRTIAEARKTMTVEEIIEVMEVARPTLYAWINKTAPFYKTRTQFLTLCRVAKLKELRDEWKQV